MRISKRIREGSARVTRAALAGVLALGLAPLPAFASDLTTGSIEVAPQTDAMSADGQIIAAAYAAANPAPEILGLDNPNQRSAQEAEQTYNFFGDPDINTNPDPYLYNHHNGLTPGVTIGGRQGSPMSALANYVGGGDYTTNPQDAVWELLPHIILGTGNDTIPENEHDFYADNARAVENALGLDDSSYNPVGVTYNRVSLPTMIQTMYRLAAAANEVSEANSSLSARYGDPLAIALNYERYILGQKGLVKKAIADGTVTEKTIALVQSYDSDAKAYTIITDGVAEGTATTNRYLEAVQGVSKNYYDTVGESGSTGVTAQQLKDNVDVIIIGGQASMESGSLAGYLQEDGLLDKTFYCTNWANGSAFGTTVNSVENAQNVGRILPCVYPEVLDQSDMIAYYYETFYHLKTGSVASVMADRMDGVRNWAKTDSASYTDWEESDYTGYVHDDVQAKLVEGMDYLNGLESQPDYLTPTNWEVSFNLSLATVELGDAILTDGEAKPEVKVTYGTTSLVEGTDYTVAYANNTEGGATGAVTITAVAGSNYAGSKTVSFTVADTDISALSINKFDASYVYTGEEITISPSFRDADGNKLTLVQGTDYSIAVKQGGNDTVLKEYGTYQVTLAGMGRYYGTVEKDVSIVPFFTVYVKEGSKDATAKKAYAQADFANLKSASTDSVSALYNASESGWNVASTNSYVTLEDLLADAGVDWKSGATVSWEAKGGNTTSYTYDELQATKFFPGAVGSKTSDVTGAVAAPLVFALTQGVATVDGDSIKTAQDAQTAALAAASDSGCPRTIVGISEADYKDPSADGAKTAGQRLWNNIIAVTITLPAQADKADKADNPMTVAAANPKAITFSAKAQVIANPLTVSKAQGTVTYAKASGDSKFTVNATTGKITVAKNTPAGTYSIGITANAAGNDSYKAGSQTKTVKITVNKAANTLKTKAGKAALKLKTLKKKAQTIKPATVAKAVVKTAGKGTTTYAQKSVTKKYKKYVSVTKKGKVAVKKGAPKGKCVITLNVKSAGNANYAAKTQTAKLAITIK